ncbi:hypothetical protein DICPUDRAFT_34067, partial [Dictyostelium purpureum]
EVEMEEAMDTKGITSTQILGRVNALLKLQEAHEELSEQMEKEILEIEKKYLLKFQPLADKRGEIIKGSVEPTEEEKGAKEPITVDNLTSKPEVKGIPNFWTIVLKNTEIGEIIETVDEEALSHLVDVKITQVGDNSDYSIDFHFSENPFFTNTVISKTVHIQEDELQSIDSTPIEWKEGKNFTSKVVKKQVKGRGKGKASTATTKMVSESVPCFFGSFLGAVAEDDEAIEDEEEDDPRMYMQFQIIAKLKDIIIPNAVEFFLGRADDQEGDNYDDFEFGGEDFDEEEDEDDDEDQVIRKPSAKGKPAVPQDPNCKQQ